MPRCWPAGRSGSRPRRPPPAGRSPNSRPSSAANKVAGRDPWPGGQSTRPSTYDAGVSTTDEPLPLRGLIIDWGGVLTAPLDEAMTAWARHEGIDLDVYGSVMRPWFLTPASPIHRLERGQLTPGEFETLLATAFRERGITVEADGLLTRMLSGLRELSDDMVSLVRRVRQEGVKTALLSNSWGEHYPEHLWVGAFDTVVISGRVGMRKPDQEIYRHT